MAVPDDEIARIEEEGVKLTDVGDWAGARARFEDTLNHEMSPFRRASILSNIARTYMKEKSIDRAAAIAREGLDVLDKGGVDASALRSDLQLIAGRLLKPVHYCVAFFGGIYWGISVSSGTLLFVHVEGYRLSTWDSWLAPPGTCLLVGFLLAKRLSGSAITAGIALYVAFLIGFAIGYGIAKAVVR